jgi:hypothetical protein
MAVPSGLSILSISTNTSIRRHLHGEEKYMCSNHVRKEFTEKQDIQGQTGKPLVPFCLLSFSGANNIKYSTIVCK